MKAYMGLRCKPGSYKDVLKQLLFSLQIDQQDLYLLFGPVDILVQFQNLNTLSEFIEKWFNPIRMIGEKEGWITKTLSFIVISESPKRDDKPYAYVFLNTKPNSLEKTRTKLLTIPEVLSADSVFGPYDIICSVKATNREELETLVLLIQQIEGIEDSTTSIVSQIKLMPDW
jgi:hypothetical protein